MSVLARIVPVVVVGAAAAGLVAIDRTEPAPAPTRYGDTAALLMPTAPAPDALTTSWFCPGVPTAAGTTGVVGVLNPSDADVEATITVHPTGGAPVTRPVVATARGRTEISLATVAPATGGSDGWAAAMVEVTGSGVLVEQVAQSAAGRSVAPCTTEPSPTWYLADGASTTDASTRVLLFNPFPDDLVVDLTATTEEGTRTSRALQGLVVPPLSVRLVDLGDAIKAKERVAVVAEARSGRFVLGRVQTWTGARREFAVALGTPSPDTTWTFAAAAKGPGTFTRFVLHNPGAADVDAVVTLFPAAGSTAPTVSGTGPAPTAPGGLAAGGPAPLRRTVKARSSVLVNLAEVPEVPDGAYAATVTATGPITVDRVRAATDGRSAVQLGARLGATRWWLPAGPGARSAEVTVFNATGLPATVTLSRLGPGGTTAIDGVAPVILAPSGSATLAVTDAAVAGQPLLVEADQPVVVERLAVSDDPPAWSSASGIPELGR
jgi:hypothetical protein